jgi:CheY-like chemotaxis protein
MANNSITARHSLPRSSQQPAAAGRASHASRSEHLPAVGPLTTGLVHDANNSLAMIVGYSDLLLADPAQLADRESVREYLELIRTAAQDASDILGALGARDHSVGLAEASAQVDLNCVVTQSVLLSRPRWRDQAQAAGATIEVRAELEPIPPIIGSACALRELLLNLIFNAVEAMPAGGSITLRTGSASGQVRLEISDTGVGMSEQVRSRCLEPYYSTKPAVGTGLGLAMVCDIVRHHGGVLEIDSRVGAGTTVRISLPVRGAALPGGLAGTGPDRPPSLRLLVVEDDPGVRRLLRQLLLVDGHLVNTAADGKAGLQQFRTGQFDLVLTDQSMPGLSGAQVAATIKSIAPSTPVVLLTGCGDATDLPGGAPPGVDLVLAKPLTLRVLRQALISIAGVATPHG